jgi:hypothetical protein
MAWAQAEQIQQLLLFRIWVEKITRDARRVARRLVLQAWVSLFWCTSW